MFMCRSLSDKYAPLPTKFEEQTLLCSDMTLESITNWCKFYDAQPPIIPVTNQRTHCRDRNASAVG